MNFQFVQYNTSTISIINQDNDLLPSFQLPALSLSPLLDAELSEVYEPRKSRFSYIAAVFYLFYTFALLFLLLDQLIMGRGDISQVSVYFAWLSFNLG